MMSDESSVWQTCRTAARGLALNRELLWQLVATELRARYVGSVLGFLWSVLHPLAMVAIFVFVFSRVLGGRLETSGGPADYGVFLCAGFLPWLAFQEVVTRSTTVYLDQANLVRKIRFPPAFLHAYVLGAAAANLALFVAALVLLLMFGGFPLGPAIAVWPFFLVLHLVFATGIGLLTSVAHVFFRDVAHVVGLGLQVWFWATPIVYPAEVIPERYRFLLALNPLSTFTQIHQGIVLWGRWPSAAEVLAALALPAGALGAGIALLALAERRIPDEI